MGLAWVAERARRMALPLEQASRLEFSIFGKCPRCLLGEVCEWRVGFFCSRWLDYGKPDGPCGWWAG